MPASYSAYAPGETVAEAVRRKAMEDQTCVDFEDLQDGLH